MHPSGDLLFSVFFRLMSWALTVCPGLCFAGGGGRWEFYFCFCCDLCRDPLVAFCWLYFTTQDFLVSIADFALGDGWRGLRGVGREVGVGVVRGGVGKQHLVGTCFLWRDAGHLSFSERVK